MPNTLPPNARLSNGYGLETDDHAKQAIRRFDQAIADKADKRTKRIRSIGRAAALSGAVLAGAFGAEVLGSDSKPQTPTTAEADNPTNPQESNTVAYTVQPGDTPWGIAKKVQLNTSGTGDIRPLVDELQQQATADGHPGLQIGEKLEVPKEADIYADVPGAQLDHK